MMNFPSHRMQAKLISLQTSVSRLALRRNAALRLLTVSRHAVTTEAQREFWLEYSLLDQEYRTAVHGLANFCLAYRGSSLSNEADSAAGLRAPRR